jgi:hypothetical protein
MCVRVRACVRARLCARARVCVCVCCAFADLYNKLHKIHGTYKNNEFLSILLLATYFGFGGNYHQANNLIA